MAEQEQIKIDLNNPEATNHFIEKEILTGKKILRKIGGAGENIYSSAVGELNF